MFHDLSQMDKGGGTSVTELCEYKDIFKRDNFEER